jgi:hypothetical protein
MVTPATAGTPAAPGSEATGTGSRSGVLDGALFGGDLPLLPQTGKLGRNLAIVRAYYTLGEQFPNAQTKAAMQKGGTVLASLDSAPGQGQGSYASIIAGQHDSQIKPFLEQMEQSAVSYHLGAIYVSFEHEANTQAHQVLGTPGQFIQAWDHVHALAAAAHLLWNDGGRLHFVLILTNLAYDSMTARPAWADSAGQSSSYFPGTNEVDLVAADGYNTGGCRGANGFVPASGAATTVPGSLFGPLVSFAGSHGHLPVFVAEWASTVYSGSNEQADFIAQMQGFVAANHEIAGVMYWSSHNPQNPHCTMSVNNQPTSLATLAVMGHSAPLQGHLVPPSSN